MKQPDADHPSLSAGRRFPLELCGKYNMSVWPRSKCHLHLTDWFKRIRRFVISIIRRFVVRAAVPAIACLVSVTSSTADTSPDQTEEAWATFWSFQPIADPLPPVTKDEAWPLSLIDRFVLARLEEAGLQPAAEAERHVLIRRLYFDLTGLPPSEVDTAAFEHDQSPDAYEKVVDRLLASPQFGERFGRHWLDIARFAESSGGGRSFMFPDAWRYRDYVIQSINEDKPLDMFITEQLAGDLLKSEEPEQRAEQLIASGFLAFGPHNYEQQDKEQLRMDVIDEQIATVGRAFLGMTLDCARCHDHKFDPVPMQDYYALAGIFRSTATFHVKSQLQSVSTWNTAKLPMSDDAKTAFENHQRQIKNLRQQIAEVKAELTTPDQSLAAKGRIDPAQLPGIVVDNEQATLIGDWMRSSSVSGFVGAGYIHDKNEGKGDKRVIFNVELPQDGLYEVRLAYTTGGNRATNVKVSIEAEDIDESVTINQRRVPPIDGTFVPLGAYKFHAGSVTVTITNVGTEDHVIVDAVQFLASTPDQSPTSVREPDQKRKQAEVELIAASIRELERRMKALEENAPPAPSVAMSVADEAKPGDWHLHEMGLPHQRGAIVPRGFLSVATPRDENGKRLQPQIPADQSGRLELAQWITSCDNPLTARVLVNRIWQKLMGQGIVKTVDNFGVTGTPPTHPMLLDHLATQFIDDGWSLKTTVRQIVLSRTYRISTTPSEAALTTDPENKLLARAHRKRLDAESMRDAMLSISGELDLTMGGHTVKKFTQYDLGYEHDMNLKRRSLYMPAFRNAVPSGFAVFDAATPNIPVGHRSVSILPTQSLYMLNAPEVMVRSEAAAKRLLSEPGLSDEQRIDLAYRRSLGRAPTSRELDIALAFISRGAQNKENERWALFMQTLYASIDFRYVD